MTMHTNQPLRTARLHVPAWARIGVLIWMCASCAHAADPPPAGAEPAPAQTIDDLLEAGQQLWDDYAPPDIKERYEFPTIETVEEFLSALQRALTDGSFDEIAAYEFDARQSLSVLRQFQGGDELADWLQPRLDLVSASNEMKAYLPMPGSTPGSAPTPPPKEKGTPLEQPYWDRVVIGREPPALARALVPRLKEIFAAEGVPPEWVWIAEVESSMNPKARSPAGARGLFQFMPATAERFGMRVSWPDERTDPEKSARAAAHYLRFLHGQFKSWPLALAAYNAGEGRVGRALKAASADSFPGVASRLPSETRLYVPKVMATVARRESIENPAALPAPKPADAPATTSR